MMESFVSYKIPTSQMKWSYHTQNLNLGTLTNRTNPLQLESSLKCMRNQTLLIIIHNFISYSKQKHSDFPYKSYWFFSYNQRFGRITRQSLLNVSI